MSEQKKNKRSKTSLTLDVSVREKMKKLADLKGMSLSDLTNEAYKTALRENDEAIREIDEKPTIIAVTNYKGGVGKTTTAANLAIELARLGEKVLLIDMDGQGNLSQQCGVYDESESFPTVAETIIYVEGGKGHIPLAEVIQHTKWEGVDIAPADIRLADADVKIRSGLEGGFETRLKTPLETLLDSEDNPGYTYVIIDCPPALNIISNNALTAMFAGNLDSFVIIPVKVDGLVMRGMQRTLEMVEGVARMQKAKTRPSYFLYTMVEKKTIAFQVGYEQLNEQFPKANYLKTWIPKSTNVPEGTLALSPVCDYEPNSPAALAYRELAREIEGMVDDEQQ